MWSGLIVVCGEHAENTGVRLRIPSGKDCNVNGEKLSASLELTPRRNPFGNAKAIFHTAFAAAKGDEGRLEPCCEDDPDPDVRTNGCLEKQGICGQVCPGKRGKSS